MLVGGNLPAESMFLRANKRFKDGKEHRYWSVVENRRVAQPTPRPKSEIPSLWWRPFEKINAKSRFRDEKSSKQRKSG